MKKTQPDDVSLWERVKQTVKPLEPRQKNRATRLAPKAAARHHTPRGDGLRRRDAPAHTARQTPTQQKKKTSPAPTKLDRKQVRRINRGKDAIEARLDLHGHHAASAHEVLRGFIRDSSARGLKWVLVVTGKGVRGEGVLRREVPLWLRSPELAPLVVGFEEAAPHKGGGGALYVRLRKTP